MNKLVKRGSVLATALGLTLSVGVSTAAADVRNLPAITCPAGNMSTLSRAAIPVQSITVTHGVRGYSGWWYQSWQVAAFTSPSQAKNWGWVKLLEGYVTTPASVSIERATTGCGL